MHLIFQVRNQGNPIILLIMVNIIPTQQLGHHPLLDLAGFGEFGFEGGDFGVHVAQDFGDGGLFINVEGGNNNS